MYGEVLANIKKTGRNYRQKNPDNLVDSWLFGKKKWEERFGDDLFSIVKGIYVAGGEDALAKFTGISFDLDNPRAQIFLKGKENKITTIPDRRWELLRTSLLNGIKNGESHNKLRDRVRKFQDFDDKYGATRIARTETTTSYNGGYYEGDDQNTLIWGHEWVAVIDTRTRDTHAAIDGQQREKGQLFSNGLKYPGDPSGPASEVIGCRCAMLAITNDERLAA